MEKHKEIRKIVLIVTQACNLSCEYCYEQHKSNKKMSFEMAKRIIDTEIEKYGKSHFLTVEFFGGEPFLNFNLIHQVVNYVMNTYSDLNVQFCATTNGTVLTEEIKNWLIENKERFECSLSLDGTPKMHNLNRKYPNGLGSYQDVAINFFTSTYENPRAKMTVSRSTLPYLYEGVKHLDELGFHTVVDLESNENYWKESDIPILEEQLNLLVDYYSNHPNIPVCRMVDYDLMRIFIDENEEYQYCGAGKNMITYDVDGNWYPCMALAPVSQGNIAEKFAYEDFKDFKFRADNICGKCKLLRLCRNCYATNFNQTGDLQSQTSLQCLINRLTILASAKIQYYRLLKKYQEHLENINDEDNAIFHAILRIQETATNHENFL